MMKTCLFHIHILSLTANYMQVYLIYMVPHLSLLYYASLPLWAYSYLRNASTLTTVPSYGIWRGYPCPWSRVFLLYLDQL